MSGDVLDNIFLASVDDCFDMDGTDAHIQRNIFLNVAKDSPRACSSNPITTGGNGTDRSELGYPGSDHGTLNEPQGGSGRVPVSWENCPGPSGPR